MFADSCCSASVAPPKARVGIRGGGEEKYTAVGGVYPPNYESGARIQKLGSYWERSLPDGSKELYEQQRGTRYYLTKIVDKYGNALALTYGTAPLGGGLRLTQIVDPLGQATILDYQAADELLITKVTDPFGRSARFEYQQQSSEWRLVRITDVVGLQSEFGYDTNGFMTSLTTPYGTSHFAKGGTGGNGTTPTNWLELTDPTGATTRIEYFRGHVAPSIFPTYPAPDSMVPDGFGGFNALMDMGITAVFDERAIAEIRNGAPNTYDKARITYWALAMTPVSGITATAVKRVEKAPLENPVWYAYANQTAFSYLPLGQHALPSKIARKLDDPDGPGPLTAPSSIEQLEYNAASNVIRRVDPVGRETAYVYGTGSTPDPTPQTGAGRDLLEVRQKNASAGWDVLARYTYDSTGHVLTSTDAAGQTTTYTYDTLGRLKTVLTPARDGLSDAQRTSTYEYNPDTGVPLGMAGRLRKVTGPSTASGSPTTTFDYDAYGRVWKATDQDGYAVTTDYDAIDRPLKVTYPDGTYEETVYNRLDAERHRDRLGRWSQTRHDARRRLVSTTDALGRTVTQTWCGCGDLMELVDANKNVTRWVRDIQGRVVSEVRANGKEYRKTYEATTSRLKSVQDPKGQVKTYSYFLDDNLQSITYQNAVVPTPSVSFTYDTYYNRLLSLTDGTGTTNYGYYPVTVPPALGAGRLASVDGPLSNDTIAYAITNGETVLPGYDELGRVKGRQINGAANETTFFFDALGRLTTETNLLGSFGFTYQGATGRLANVAYPNGQRTSYAYFGNSGDQRLQEIHHKQPGGATLSKFNYTYDSVGNIKTWAQQQDANPAKLWEYGYDAADQLAQARITAPTPLPTPNRYTYGYDAAGNRTAEQIDDLATLSQYNNMNQLVQQGAGGSVLFKGTVSEPAQMTVAGQPVPVQAVDLQNPPRTEFRWEGRGQGTTVQAGTMDVVITATDFDNHSQTKTYRVPVSGTPKTLGYDDNGNLTSDGTKTYEWDAEDRLTAIVQGTHRSEFTYDGLYRRVRVVEKDGPTVVADSRFLWVGRRIYEERDSGGTAVLRRFMPQGITEGTSSYFYARDHLGSVGAMLDTTGTLRARYEYDPYGRSTKLVGDKDAPHGYTGHYVHAPSRFNLPLFRAYAPELARWTSEDPIGLLAGPNLYSYVHGDPIGTYDPLGLDGGATAVVATAPVWSAPAWLTTAGAVAVNIAGAIVLLLVQEGDYNPANRGLPIQPPPPPLPPSTATGGSSASTGGGAGAGTGTAGGGASTATSGSGSNVTPFPPPPPPTKCDPKTQKLVICTLVPQRSSPGWCVYQCPGNGNFTLVQTPSTPGALCPPVYWHPVP